MILYSRVSRYFLFSFALVLTFIFFHRNIEAVMDMDLYLEELIFLKSGSLIESRLFWKGEYFFLILLKIFAYILDPKIGLYLLVFSGIILYLNSLNKIAKFYGLNPLYILILTFCSVYFYLVFGNTLRQGIALGLGINTIVYYYNRKYWLAVVFGILTLLTHRSAVVLFIYPIISVFFKTNLKTYWRFLLPIILYFLFMNYKDYFFLKISGYSLENEDLIKDSIKLVTSLILSLLILIYWKRIPDYLKYTFILTTFLSTMFITFNSISSRFLLYNQALTPLILLFLIKKKNQVLLIPFGIIYFGIMTQTGTIKSLFPF